MSETPRSDDPRERPYDPAGTRPRHRPQDIVPRAKAIDADAATRGSALWSGPEAPAAPTGDAPGVPVTAAATTHPDPPAEAVREPSHLDEHPGLAPVPPGRGAVPARAASRIQFLLGALLALAAAGVAVAVLITLSGGGDDGPSGPRWSAFRPAGDGKERVTDIANRVGRQYRGTDGGQLVVVTGGPLEVAGIPLTVALREPADQGGDIEIEDGKGILFRLCGLGEKCAIGTGAPSRERHLLLRREALELALYTFHYVDVDQVVVFMPPPKGKDPDEALFFKRGDLEPQIERPLAQSLAPRTPSVASVTRSADASFVQDLTLETLFKFSLTQGNSDDSAFLVLDPLLATTP